MPNCQCEHADHFNGRNHSYNAVVGAPVTVTFNIGGTFQFCRYCANNHGPSAFEKAEVAFFAQLREELERCDDCGQRSSNG